MATARRTPACRLSASRSQVTSSVGARAWHVLLFFFLKEVHGMYYYFFLKEVSEQAVGAIATQVHFDRPTV
jgi:hypothetical protein